MFRISIYLIATASLISSCKKESSDPLKQVSNFLAIEADSLENELLQLKNKIEENNNGVDSVAIQQLFSNSRKHYKQIEAIVEFHFPGVADALNGPALPEADEYDDKVILPTGFQMVEEMLFPTVTVVEHDLLLQELNSLIAMMTRLKGQIETNSWSAENIFEASRLQFLRMISLGISGFDSPVAFQSISETRHALKGMRQVIFFFSNQVKDQRIIKELTDRFAAADKYLLVNTDFSSFNRAEFIVDHINPLSQVVYEYQLNCGISNNKWLSAVDMTKTNFADPKSIQYEWFAPTYNRELVNKQEVVSLGKMLFFDPILSGNNARSCASCHQPKKAFTDGKVKSLAFNLKGIIERNAPTIINSGFQKSQFADSRVHFLEDQITDVMSNASEMHGQINEATIKIQGSEEYQSLFTKAFASKDGSAVTKERIQLAIATFIRSLNGLNSKVDNYLEGDKTALNEGEIAGLNLFMGKAKCATCHFMPLFNGSVPPMYNETESEVLGVPSRPDTMQAKVDSDLGKFHTYNRELHKNAFKTPTVRNVAITAPYMHNGVYKTLEEVIDFYNRGGGVGIGIELSNQTLPPDPLNLSAKEKKQLIEFIHALTDTVNLTSIPKRLPAFKDKKLDVRKIGGDY
jgi:cytochrome c peroxidase